MAVNINCPFEQTLTATGTGILEIQKTGTFVYGSSPDITFSINVNAGAFASNFITIANTDNNAQDPTFSLSAVAKAMVKEALQAATADSLVGVTTNQYAPFDAGNNKLNHYVANWAQNSIKTALESDLLAAFLTAEEIKDLALTDFPGACDSAVDSLWTTLEGKLPEVVYQYNNAAWMRVANADSTEPTTIPLKEGDSMTFRFNVGASFTITPEDKAPASLTAGAPASAMTNTLGGVVKKVNLVLNFIETGGLMNRA